MILSNRLSDWISAVILKRLYMKRNENTIFLVVKDDE